MPFSLRKKGKTEKTRTEWDFELWFKLNRLSDLIYAPRGRIVYEALKMEDKNLWKCLEKHLLGCFVRGRGRGRLDDLHGTGL
jgi:hypothetical protein